MSVKSVILDTDIDTDCDDTAALGIIHETVRRGECDLVGVVCSVPVQECVATARAINQWYGRGDIPVGLLADELASDAWRPYRTHRDRIMSGQLGFFPYHDAVAAAAERAGSRPDPIPDDNAVALYRRLLASAADRSVTICAVGTLSALSKLLQSEPDEHSPLTGMDLVRGKVAELVTMALASYPRGKDRFNWRMDWPAAVNVLRTWPTLVVTSEHGAEIPTGPRLMDQASPDHPVRVAYRTFLGAGDRTRPSWDLVAAVYAVRGLAGPFALGAPCSLEMDTDAGTHAWLPATARDLPRRYLAPMMKNQVLADYLESLLLGEG